MTKSGNVLAVCLILGVAGCARAPVEEVPSVPAPASEPEASASPAAEWMVAVAAMQPRADQAITGSVSFVQAEADASVVISAHFEGVSEGVHGLHVHENGDCTSGDFKSAGGHFNPQALPHAGPQDMERHAGDLGNIECDAQGVCHLELESDLLTVEEGPASVVGRAVILHEKMDDLVSQPTGAAGPRLACGVIALTG